MKKSGFILIGLVIALAIIAFFLVRTQSDKKSILYDFSFREFAVSDIETISKIVLHKRDGETVKLSRQDDRWYVNDQFLAAPGSIANLLFAIQNVRIDYVPTEAAYENIIKSMMYNSIKVELYDKDDKPVKKYYVGDSPDNNVGTYYVMEGSGSPLVMSLPGQKSNLRVRFSYTADEWRDKTIYNLDTDRITELTIRYFWEKENSFTVTRSGEDFTAGPAFPGVNKPVRKIDAKMARSYLLGFSNIGSEYIANSIEAKDDIISRRHIAEIEMKLDDGKNKKLEIFMLPLLDEDVVETDTGIEKYFNHKVWRYAARDENDDLFIIQYLVFEDIFLGLDDFLR
jgi:hypothetical protein